MTIEETYQQWRSTLKRPDDSVFYYHRSLERILLGLAIYVLSSRSLTDKLGKAEMYKILNLQVPDLLTAWIDEDEQSFESLFPMVMNVTDGLLLSAGGAEKQFPKSWKQIRQLISFLGNSVGLAGDMDEDLAEELLDDLSTDGEKIYSDKIRRYGDRLLFLTRRHGMDFNPYLDPSLLSNKM